MFIAMNRFKVRKGSERDFEQVWLARQTHLEQVQGFMIFHLLKGQTITCSTLPIASGARRSALRRGRARKLSAKRMPAPVPASRSISVIPNSSASQFCRK
jgi:hypothetical protein